MNSTLQRVILVLKSRDVKARKGAITDLALLLEMHLWNLDYDDRVSGYKTLLDDDALIGVFLTETEQQELVDFIKDLILGQDQLNSSLIWAIGKSKTNTGLIPILEIIGHPSLTFDDEESYQTLIVLGNFLFFNESNVFSEENRQVITQSNLLLFLEKVVSTNLEDGRVSNRLRETAQGLLDMTNEAINAIIHN